MENQHVDAEHSVRSLRLVDGGYDESRGEEGRGRRIIRRVGFGLGALVFALVLIGEGIFLSASIRGGDLSGAAPAAPATGSLAHRLDVILARVLGPSDRGVRRFRVLRVAALPATTGRAAPGSIGYPEGRGTQRVPRGASGGGSSGGGGDEVVITWAINNDLSGGTVGNGAEAEVYTMLRALYTSHLPIALVRLYGTYPLSGRSDPVVMRLSMDRQTAALIGSVGWDTLDPETLWPLVRRMYVNPNLQPQSSE